MRRISVRSPIASTMQIKTGSSIGYHMKSGKVPDRKSDIRRFPYCSHRRTRVYIRTRFRHSCRNSPRKASITAMRPFFFCGRLSPADLRRDFADNPPESRASSCRKAAESATRRGPPQPRRLSPAGTDAKVNINARPVPSLPRLRGPCRSRGSAAR